MKEKTRETADLIRGLAGFILLVGLIISFVSIAIGIMSFAKMANVAVVFRMTSGVTFIIIGIATAFTHLMSYAILNGFAMIVENSDRTETNEALYEISDVLKETSN